MSLVRLVKPPDVDIRKAFIEMGHRIRSMISDTQMLEAKLNVLRKDIGRLVGIWDRDGRLESEGGKNDGE